MTDVSGDSQAARPRRSGRARSGLWPPPQDAWLPLAGVALLFAGHFFYAAIISDMTMLMSGAGAAILGGALLSPRLRADLLRLKGLQWPGLFFALTVAVALWTLTPWTPGGPHPVWAYAGVSPGASTIDKSATTIEIVKLVGLACLFLIGAASGARDERARFAVQATLAAGVAFGLWAFVGLVAGAITPTAGQRLAAHFFSANTAATFFAVLLLLAIAELQRRRRLRGSEREASATIVAAAAALVFAVCLLDTASRGGVLAFLGAAGVYVLVLLASGALKASRAVLATLAGVILLGLVAWFAGDALVERFFHAGQDVVVRTAIWKPHWAAFLDSPLFGYGLGTEATVHTTLITASNFEALGGTTSVHNVYLQWLVEAGLVGAAPMFLCVGALMAATVRGLLRRSRMVGLLAALIAVDAVFLLHGITDLGLQAPSIAGLWAWLLGLQFALAQGSSRR